MPFFLFTAGFLTAFFCTKTLIEGESQEEANLSGDQKTKSSGRLNETDTRLTSSSWKNLDYHDYQSISCIHLQKHLSLVMKENPCLLEHITSSIIGRGDMNMLSFLEYSIAARNSSHVYRDQHEPQHEPQLFELVKQSRWKQLRRNLKGRKGIDRCRQRDDTGLTLLGIALGYHAPLDIIELIITIDPDQLIAVDIYGSNALHIACLNGAPFTSITYVLKKCSVLASSRDKDDRVPLHHVTECICRNEIEFVEGLKVINALCDCDPTMIHAQDRKDKCPLDIVHGMRMNNDNDLSGLELELEHRESRRKRLVKLCWFLRRISFQVYRQKKEKWEQNQACYKNAIKTIPV